MRIYILILLLLVCAISCKKEKKIQYGDLNVSVKDEKDRLLTDFQVKISGNDGFEKQISASENYTFEKIPVGQYQVSVSRENYISETKVIEVNDDLISSSVFILKVGKATLEVSESRFEMSSSKTSITLNITSNSDWAISGDVPWIIVAKKNGNGNDNITFDMSENKDDIARTATFEVTCGSISKTVIIIQDFSLKIISSSLSYPISDSITVLFNKPAVVTSFKSLNTLCMGNMGYKYLPKSSGIKFRYSCARMFGSYPFEITISDGKESLKKAFTIDFYTKKIPLPENHPSNLSTYFITDDNKNVWVAAFNSNVVRKVNIESFEIETQYTLNIKVHKLYYNAFNKLIYILSSSSAEIQVMDPSDGRIVKVIKIKTLPEDTQAYPEIYPTDIAVTDSGIGALLCGSNISNNVVWKMIDCKKDDLIYYHPEKAKIHIYGSLELNKDKSQIYIKAAFENRILLLDVKSNGLTEFFNPVSGALGSIVPNKKNDNLLFIQTYEQYLFNQKTNYVSKITYLGHGGQGNFYYGPGEDQIVFMFDADNNFNVFNYRTGETYLKFPTLTNMYAKPLTTTDGKYLILCYNFTLYKFNTALFYTSP
jgi:hypothetical protein